MDLNVTALQTQTLEALQGTPCKSIPTGKNLFLLQGTPVLIAGPLFSLQGFPCKPLYFLVRDCNVHNTNVITLFSTLHSLVFSKDFFKGTCEFLVTRRDFYHAVLCTIASLGLPSSQLDAANTTYLTFTLR